jgi:hypothetical protein
MTAAHVEPVPVCGELMICMVHLMLPNTVQSCKGKGAFGTTLEQIKL